ncbi:MAG: VWA domain-containing protein [Planctomycetes bacterium]|nr:VWA domain-containing protein [Planctomycetota bacterium]
MSALSAVQEAAPSGVASVAQAQWRVIGDLYLAEPEFLALAPLALALLYWGRRARARAAGRVPQLPSAALPHSWTQRLGWIPVVLQGLALVLVSVALARPVRGNAVRTTISEGIDIALVLDRSGSMKYDDLEKGKTRLDVAKEVLAAFAERRMTDRVGAADSCALLTFAQYPALLCPFTLDFGAFKGFLDGVQYVRNEIEDGTAIGRGLAKAVSVLAETDARSKVVVLLTDGENNVLDITPIKAAELAKEKGVRVYTVLAGRFAFQEDVFGRIYATERELDSSELQQIAELTGGRFFRAKDRGALDEVYATIEALERTERREERYTETFDLYFDVLLAALVCYALAWFSFATWARSLP